MISLDLAGMNSEDLDAPQRCRYEWIGGGIARSVAGSASFLICCYLELNLLNASKSWRTRRYNFHHNYL